LHSSVSEPANRPEQMRRTLLAVACLHD